MELGDANLDAVIKLVREHTGIAMNENKRVLLQGRLLPRMRALGLASYEDYIAHLRRGGPEVVSFIDSVTTNDSAFFRTPAVWWYLNDEFLVDWHARMGATPLRIWSAAAATGEEAYSMSMLCLEFQRQHPAFRFAIDATDISAQALEAARGATYRGRTVERFELTRPALFRRYLAGGPERWTVLPEVREHVSLGSHNLLAPAQKREHYDLVLLRNVLIYFDEDNQRRILGQIRGAMRAGSRLILGEQESITRLNTPFEFEQAHVYRIAGGQA